MLSDAGTCTQYYATAVLLIVTFNSESIDFNACPDALMLFSCSLKKAFAWAKRSIPVKKSFGLENLALIAGSTSFATLKYSLVLCTSDKTKPMFSLALE